MKLNNTELNEHITVLFNNKTYTLELDCLLYVLSALENKEVEFVSQKQVEKLMEYYCLYDEYFLENINKLNIK